MRIYRDYVITNHAEAELIKQLLDAVRNSTGRKYAKKRKQLEDPWFNDNIDRLLKGWQNQVLIKGSSETCRNGGGRRKLLEDLMAAGCEILGLDPIRLGDTVPGYNEDEAPAVIHDTNNGEEALSVVEQAVVDAHKSMTGEWDIDSLSDAVVDKLLESAPRLLAAASDVMLANIGKQIRKMLGLEDGE